MNNALKLLALTFIPLLPGLAAGDPQPNIILVMPDDVGYGDYACFGNPVMKTPAVDAFKKQSLLFTKFHVSPTCAPTRAALMSGRHEFKNGVTHTIYERERMSLATFTLPQMLKSAGYTTGIFGKWHLGDEEDYRPESRGFDEVYTHGGGGIGQTYPGSCGDAPGNTNINPALWHNGKWVKTTGYCTDLFFDQSIKWMDAKRKEEKPFFAYISLNAAHSPYVLPEEYYQHYLGKPGVNDTIAKFFGMVENIDTNFGTLLKKIDEWGISHNTLVIYLASDNGGTKGIHIHNAGMRGSKGRPYQGGTRVPCFFRWPGGKIPAGEKCDALSSGTDIFPTLAAITGAELSEEVKQQVEGRNLLPLLKDPAGDWPYRMLVHHVGRWDKGKVEEWKHTACAIEDGRYRLVNNKELFDLESDFGERQNLISKKPEVVAKLRAEYDRWWKQLPPFLVNEDAFGPKVNPMKALYWEQFGGGPDEKMRWQMKPDRLINAHKKKKPGKSAEKDNTGDAAAAAEAAAKARGEKLPERMQWWKEAKLGMFIHWGAYSTAGGEWNGETNHHEWLQFTAKIPLKEYTEFARTFDPKEFNPDEWVSIAKNAGMKYMIITSKHHDGIAMYDSKVSEHNIMRLAGLKRDPIRQLAEACRKQGIRFGVYYSLGRDWEDPDVPTGKYKPGWRSNLVDFPDEKNKVFNRYFKRKAMPQVRELLTNYGPIDVMWFDTPELISPGESREMLDMIRSIQPNCIVNQRVGSDLGDYGTPEQTIPPEASSSPWETCMTLNKHWAYNKADHKWKSAGSLIRNLVDIASKGGNYLLNVGPTGEGSIPPPSVERLSEIGEWLEINGEAIYNCGPTPFGDELGSYSKTEKDGKGRPKFIARKEWRATTQPGRLYIHVLAWPSEKLMIPAVDEKIAKAYLLADSARTPLDLSRSKNGVSIALPKQAPDANASVICLELSK